MLWLLIGWQFTLAEFVGGAIMVVLLGLARPRLIPRGWIEAARRLDAGADSGSGAHSGAEGQDGGPDTLAGRLRQRSRWADAADHTIAGLTMLRREIVIGLVVAGFAAVAVPVSFWNAVFLHHHGVLTLIENAVARPFVAMISGATAFICADLIALPLLFVYRKMYGGHLTLRLLGVFWLLMSAAGLLVELIFDAVGAVPATRPAVIAPERFGCGYTTILNLVFPARGGRAVPVNP